jgi:hypothetical protein
VSKVDHTKKTSREAAQEYSPWREPWGGSRGAASPEGTKEKIARTIR